MVEHGFRKAGVMGSSPVIGCMKFWRKFYLMGISDTTSQAQKIQCDIYSRMSPARKIELIFDAYRTGQLLSMAGLRNQYPTAGEDEVWHIWAKRHLGEELYNKVYGVLKMANPQDIAVLEKLTEVLEKLHIAYCIGGSMASSVYGTVRFTQDADITVQPFGPTAEKFFETLKSDFYISRDAMLEALKNRSSFNIIHFATAFKIDVFIQADNDFQKQMLARQKVAIRQQ